jgi:hypothetical protein
MCILNQINNQLYFYYLAKTFKIFTFKLNISTVHSIENYAIK